MYKDPVAQLIKGYRREDWPSTPQPALPIVVPEEYQTAGNILMATGNLVVIVLYYLLRVWENTKPILRTIQGKTKWLTRTIQFSIPHIGFSNKENITKEKPTFK